MCIRDRSYRVTARDIEDGLSPVAGLVFSIDENARQAGFAINASSGLLTWTPTAIGAGSVTVTITDNGDPTTHNNKLSEGQQITVPVVRRPTTNSPAKIDSEPTGPAS